MLHLRLENRNQAPVAIKISKFLLAGQCVREVRPEAEERSDPRLRGCSGSKYAVVFPLDQVEHEGQLGHTADDAHHRAEFADLRIRKVA